MSDETPPTTDGDAPHSHGLPGGIGNSQECLVCPVCVFLQAMTQARPEVTQHLLAAARELTLALRAVVETQVEAYEQATDDGKRFQRITVD